MLGRQSDLLDVPDRIAFAFYHKPQVENKGHGQVNNDRRAQGQERSIDKIHPYPFGGHV